MHLWPSMKLRDSFKSAYIKKLEWNLGRRKSAKRQSQNQQRLLDDQGENDDNHIGSDDSSTGRFVLLCREVLMVLSCCYCCFCCGACIEDEESR